MDCSPWCCRSWSCDAERVLPITTAPGRGYCGDTAVPIAVPTVPTVPTVIETCGLLAPFDDMDALRHFSNHVYFKYMGNCRRKEPPKDWVKSLQVVNHEKIKPEQSYYLFGLASFATLATLWAHKVPRPTDEECL